MPEITIELQGIKLARKRHSPKVVKKAAVSALNKTVRAARTSASKQIRKTYTIKKKDLDKRTMKIIRATRHNLKAIISVSGRPLSLFKFRAKQLKKGTKVTIIRGRRTLLLHHFIAVVKTKKVGVTRAGVFRRTTTKRFPIVDKRMVSMPSIFSGKKVMPQVQRTIRNRWPRTFSNELKFFRAKQAR